MTRACSSTRRPACALAALFVLLPFAAPRGAEQKQRADQAEARTSETRLAHRAEARASETRLARQAEARASERRLVAIGDVHGNVDGFVAILRRAALIDTSNRWIGGTSTLVQTGDVTDRGLGVRDALDLLMTLNADARRAGGRVVALLGNHEVMNLLGNTRDVNPDLYAAFADAQSESRRETAWAAYAKLAEAQPRAAAGLPPPYDQTRDAWMAAHPPGYLEYRDAFRPRGRYGAWLRQRDIAARIDGTLLMHAGPPVPPPARVEDLNATAQRELARFDRFVQDLIDRKLALPFFSFNEILEAAANQIRLANAFIDAQRLDRDSPRPALGSDELREAEAVLDISRWSLLAPQGPLWIRGYATWPETEHDTVAATLKALDATRLVVGHTPRSTGITARFGGLVHLIDTGMLASVYKGMPSALEIAGERVTPLYVDKQEVSSRSGLKSRPSVRQIVAPRRKSSTTKTVRSVGASALATIISPAAETSRRNRRRAR